MMGSLLDDSRLDSAVVRLVANRRLKTLENLEKLIRSIPPSRIKAVHTVSSLQRADPNSCNASGLVRRLFRCCHHRFWWLDCEGCRALVTLSCQKQQHAISNSKNTSTRFVFDNDVHRVHSVVTVVRSSRV